MRVEFISDDFIVGAIGHNPLILSILDPEGVNELLLKLSGVLADKELRSLVEASHSFQVEGAPLVLVKCVLVLALFLAHLAVVLVFS